MTKPLFAILLIAIMFVASQGSATKRIQAKDLSTERHADHPQGPPPHGHHPPPPPEEEEEPSELHNESESEYSEERHAVHPQGPPPHGHHPPPPPEEEEPSELHNESESEYSEERQANQPAKRRNHFASHYAEAAAATPATPAKATTFGQILIGAVLALVL